MPRAGGSKTITFLQTFILTLVEEIFKPLKNKELRAMENVPAERLKLGQGQCLDCEDECAVFEFPCSHAMCPACTGINFSQSPLATANK